MSFCYRGDRRAGSSRSVKARLKTSKTLEEGMGNTRQEICSQGKEKNKYGSFSYKSGEAGFSPGSRLAEEGIVKGDEN